MSFFRKERIDCVHNGYAYVRRGRKNGGDPKVIFVESEKHAYVQDGDEVLNKGVTWGTDYYPDYSQQELEEKKRRREAEDITPSLDKAFDEEGLFSIGEKKFPLFKRRLK